jgi:hypothetical protein
MDNLGMDDPASISDAGPDCWRGLPPAHSRARLRPVYIMRRG